MNIGRFSADSVTDVTNMVDKTLAYASAPTTDNWNQNILFVADNLQGGGGNFYKFSDSIVDGVVQGASGSTPLIPQHVHQNRGVYRQGMPSRKSGSDMPATSRF